MEVKKSLHDSIIDAKASQQTNADRLAQLEKNYIKLQQAFDKLNASNVVEELKAPEPVKPVVTQVKPLPVVVPVVAPVKVVVPVQKQVVPVVKPVVKK